MMNQTKLESMLEIFFNYLSGFVVAYLTYRHIVMPTPWLKDSPLLVTTLFTLVSVIRSYLWRRFFNKGLHLAVHRFATRLVQAARRRRFNNLSKSDRELLKAMECDPDSLDSDEKAANDRNL